MSVKTSWADVARGQSYKYNKMKCLETITVLLTYTTDIVFSNDTDAIDVAFKSRLEDLVVLGKTNASLFRFYCTYVQ